MFLKVVLKHYINIMDFTISKIFIIFNSYIFIHIIIKGIRIRYKIYLYLIKYEILERKDLDEFSNKILHRK